MYIVVNGSHAQCFFMGMSFETNHALFVGV